MASNSRAKCSQNVAAQRGKNPAKDGMHVGNMNMIAVAIAISAAGMLSLRIATFMECHES